MNILKIAEVLESYSESHISCKLDLEFTEAVTEAVSLLISQGEQIADLQNELRQIKAERDAAIGDLERIKYCGACKHCDSLALPIPEVCKQCSNGSNWEWREVKTEVDYGN